MVVGEHGGYVSVISQCNVIFQSIQQELVVNSCRHPYLPRCDSYLLAKRWASSIAIYRKYSLVFYTQQI
jgi:hypothetical protein